MAKKTYRAVKRELTPRETRIRNQALAAAQAEKAEIIAQGRESYARSNAALQETAGALRAERERQGLTLADIEARTGIDRPALSRLESAKNPNPTIATLDKVAGALGRTLRVSLEDSEMRHALAPDWARDELSRFIDAVYHNCVATGVNLRTQYERLARIDDVFRLAIDNLTNSPCFVAGMFLPRAHSCFRAAAMMALSGQLPESFMILRSGLESSLYALFLFRNTERQETWLKRHVDATARKRNKSEFQVKKLMDHLSSIDLRTGRILAELYEEAIDYGGHPNERALTTQTELTRNSESMTFTANYFVCGELSQQFALKRCAQVGICVLDVFRHVLGSRYEILGIDLRLDEARAGL